MKKKFPIHLTILFFILYGCSKINNSPSSLVGFKVSIGKISLTTNFLDYANMTKNKLGNLSLDKSNKFIYSLVSNNSDSISSWQHVFSGNALLQYTPLIPTGTVIKDSVNLNSPQSYSRNLNSGIYNISLFSKPTIRPADTFIRFIAADSSINIVQNQYLNFVGQTSDGLITIPVGIVKSGTIPTFKTFYNNSNQVFNFGIKNGYYFLYVKNLINGTINVVIPNSTILSKNLTVNQNIQYNINTTLKSNIGGISLIFSSFYFQGLKFDNSYSVTSFNDPSISTILNQPSLIAMDDLNNIYIAEHGSNKISIVNSNGIGADFAGSGAYMNESMPSINGPRLSSTFLRPTGVAVDQFGNKFIADQGIDRIRKIDASGNVTTLAGSGYIWSQNTDKGTDGLGILATFINPYGIAVDQSENVYVTDWDAEKIRKIDMSGNVTTIAGTGSPYPIFNDGSGIQATFTQPTGIVVDSQGNLYIADQNIIRKIDINGMVTTFAGQKSIYGNSDGPRLSSLFNHTWGIAIDKSNNLFITDIGNHNIRKIDPSGNVTTIAGNGTDASVDGDGLNASFGLPYGIYVSKSGDILVSDYEFNKIRKISQNK